MGIFYIICLAVSLLMLIAWAVVAVLVKKGKIEKKPDNYKKYKKK